MRLSAGIIRGIAYFVLIPNPTRSASVNIRVPFHTTTRLSVKAIFPGSPSIQL